VTNPLLGPFTKPPAGPSTPAPPLPSVSDTVHGLMYGGVPAWEKLFDSAAHLAINLVIAASIFFFTLWAARSASRLASKATGRLHRGAHPDTILQSFVGSLARYGVMVIGIIAVLQQLGVRTTSVIAVLGAASLAIGLALQGGLSNVAAGVMLLLLRPYRVGDRVEIAGRVGRVRGLDLFMTRLTDLDNLLVFIPNGKAFGDIIVNYTMPENRRIVMEFKIDFEDDLDFALELLIRCAKADPRIVADPAPWAKVTSINDSTVTVTLRAWTDPHGYIDTRFDLIKTIKQAFDHEGLTFAYPHQVAVETRPWTRPSTARQQRNQKKIEENAEPGAAPPTDGEALGSDDARSRQERRRTTLASSGDERPEVGDEGGAQGNHDDG